MIRRITENKSFKIAKLLCFALLTANAFTVDFLDFPGKFNYLTVLLTFVFYIFYSCFDAKECKISKTILVFASLTAFFLLVGKVYAPMNSTELLWGSKKRLLQSFLCLIGYTLFFYRVYVIVNNAFYALSKKEDSLRWFDAIIKGKTGILKTSGIILVIWLPILLICYPGALNADASYQIWQGVGRYAYDNIHPLTDTLLLKVCLEIGKMLGSYNRGLYLHVLIQTVSLIFVMSYSLHVLYKKEVNRIYIFAVMLIYIFAPMYSNFATTTIKDTLFATWILLYVTVLFDFLYGNDKKMTLKSAIEVVSSASLVMLFRNNGVIFVIGSAIPLAICLWKNEAKIWRKILGIVIYVILPFAVFVTVTLALTYGLSATRINGKESLSIPFQQTARYVREYYDEVTPKEWEVMEGVFIQPESLGALYDPNISDPIKRQYSDEASNADVIRYLTVWAKMFFKHPGVYFEAFFNHIYGWFDVGAVNDIRYTAENNLFYPPRWGDYEDKVSDWYSAMFRNPILGLLDVVGVYVWWMFLLVYHLAKNKKGFKWTIFMIPLLLSLLVCMASPCFYQHPRYAFPITFTMPFLTGALITAEKNKERGCRE